MNQLKEKKPYVQPGTDIIPIVPSLFLCTSEVSAKNNDYESFDSWYSLEW